MSARPEAGQRQAGLERLARRVITGWALLGGVLLLAVVLLNTVSVLGAALITLPFPGDFELTEMGVCVAVFTFLPWCQMNDENVTADIFTSGLSRAWVAKLVFVSAVVAFLFTALMGWRMSVGMLDQRDYGYTTTILQIPHWYAFVPILVSLALLAVAAVLTMIDATRGSTGYHSDSEHPHG
ncbi:TRAP transporter small permease [Oceanicella sp. SM1341]|uniref:TRAP transporter small permease n=1 Tax=Oceanicella sp. SM1341 TaxID=1548889 RepID=UPI001E529F57|nr:TRAP transporter small permease [Oceanicella sp. SM1341]